MQVIYTNRKSCNRLFTITNARDTVPADAVVCAICHGKRSIRNLDDAVLGSLTNDEFMRLARMIKTAIERETDPNYIKDSAHSEIRENVWAIRASRFGHQSPAVARGLARIHERRLRSRLQTLGATLLFPALAAESVKSAPNESETVMQFAV